MWDGRSCFEVAYRDITGRVGKWTECCPGDFEVSEVGTLNSVSCESGAISYDAYAVETDPEQGTPLTQGSASGESEQSDVSDEAGSNDGRGATDNDSESAAEDRDAVNEGSAATDEGEAPASNNRGVAPSDEGGCSVSVTGERVGGLPAWSLLGIAWIGLRRRMRQS